MITITVNRTRQQIDVAPETPLLWVLREKVGLRVRRLPIRADDITARA